jgi:hypothetical protein
MRTLVMGALGVFRLMARGNGRISRDAAWTERGQHR